VVDEASKSERTSPIEEPACLLPIKDNDLKMNEPSKHEAIHTHAQLMLYRDLVQEAVIGEEQEPDIPTETTFEEEMMMLEGNQNGLPDVNDF
jgi:hypothetical protein